MADEATGTGDALDATVDTSRTVSPSDDRGFAEYVVACARVKVAKQRTHLADAERALTEAEAALAALEKGN